MTFRRMKPWATAPVLALLAGADVSAQEKWGVCTPSEVVTYQVRVHVRCANAVEPNIIFFAAGTEDPAFASRVLSVVGVARLMNLNVAILFDPNDLSGASIGCLNMDCRKIRAVGFGAFAPAPPAPPAPPTPPSPRQECLASCDDVRDACSELASSLAARNQCVGAHTRCRNQCPGN